MGIVEKISGYACEECAASGRLFDGTAGADLSEEFDVPLLATVPFTPGSNPASGERDGPIEALVDEFLRVIR